ncbi:hypothetical protein H5399_12420 [Tessaracoccus sp. MC1627]|uniref:hypothetical protein n=1 Tax=Tessaracoccus sp. MC1627 TaxID=2760312 RepID=UPI001602CA72|nr:hypothetical protein [Tessaracoccus sp. MC1627]MBB1513267.1 hypothetical protein [Tessaracoccus sp. MC1627]MBB1513400.1 hypothetical protein [Tessaracoccus sp. MC1627]
MATLEHRNHARSFLKKAEEYLASAEANLSAERYTVAAGDAIHAGICAKDAIVTQLTGSTVKGKDHALAAKELRRALGQRPDAAGAEKGLRELVSNKADVEHGVSLMSAVKAEALVRRARSLVEIAVRVVRLNG